jgi:hypothetical protein
MTQLIQRQLAKSDAFLSKMFFFPGDVRVQSDTAIVWSSAFSRQWVFFHRPTA